ncbi:hypothetical protein CERSUDRAFT_115958 [Gelatoporia subvermispora B]|uniref:Uncharacterized protein n=1 Tax=Ceriporiopsis subvermispora (strain B) TaxID=914234 RepID=M2RB83_CERS8|nr:hypothetical protein CERSUDRAFT_115958 [Gelatoporia subvermispora B]
MRGGPNPGYALLTFFYGEPGEMSERVAPPEPPDDGMVRCGLRNLARRACTGLGLGVHSAKLRPLTFPGKDTRVGEPPTLPPSISYGPRRTCAEQWT